MTFPDWVGPLDKMLPKLATAIRYALAVAANDGDMYRPASAQKAKAGAKAPPPAKKADPKAADKVTRALVSMNSADWSGKSCWYDTGHSADHIQGKESELLSHLM